MDKRPRSSPTSTASSSFSSCSSSCSVSPLSSPCILSPIPTTIYAQVPDERNYSALLRQTELVYDQLLAERQRKLQQKISERQTEYQEKYTQLSHTNRTKAAEFERWAASALRQLRDECLEELSELRQDYEAKFAKLQVSLEDQRTAEHREHRKPQKTVHFMPQQSPSTAVPLHHPMYLGPNRR